MSGFETVSLSDIDADTDTTISASNSEDIRNIVTDGTVESKVSFVNMGSADIEIDANGETSDGGDITIDNSGVTTLNYKGRWQMLYWIRMLKLLIQTSL